MVQSHLALPLRAGKTVVGGLLLATPPSGTGWRDEVVEPLYLLAEVVAHALERTHTERETARLVILNLVLNGLEAMGKPTGRDHILVVRTSLAGPTSVSVAVEDSSTGIGAADVRPSSSCCRPTRCRPGHLGLRSNGIHRHARLGW